MAVARPAFCNTMACGVGSETDLVLFQLQVLYVKPRNGEDSCFVSPPSHIHVEYTHHPRDLTTIFRTRAECEVVNL